MGAPNTSGASRLAGSVMNLALSIIRPSLKEGMEGFMKASSEVWKCWRSSIELKEMLLFGMKIYR